MKACIVFLLLIITSATGFGQSQRARIPQELQDIAVPVPTTCQEPNMIQPASHSGSTREFLPEATYAYTIGTTYYDLQTNKSNQNRFYLYPDGSMGATWMYGLNHPVFPDRGTGYNYFTGTVWGSYPTSRIETIKVGWPSYAPLGPNGEIIVSHIGSTGLNISKRTIKGTGIWLHTSFPGPTANPNLLWPRMITSGASHNNIHIMAITAPVANAGTLYNGSDGALLYSRSLDGGLTWGILNQQVPGTDTSAYLGLSGDCYAWAEPKGNTLAFVVGDSWHDLFLLKSTNNGTSWTKTVIWQHHYPFFNKTSPIATDTFYCVDGSLAATIDNAGMVHVFFGVNRSYSDGVGTFWFPLVDGLGYWNESMPPISSSTPKDALHPDSLDNKGQLVGYALDVNNNGSIDITSVGYYYLSVSSMPTALIDSLNHIYLVYSSVMENLSNGLQNYRHLLARKSVDGGSTWGNIVNVNSSIVFNFSECVFPSIAPLSDNKIHLIFQEDEEPGLAVRGDEDPYYGNQIIYLNFDKTDLIHIPPGPQWTCTQTAFQHKIALPPLSAMLVNNQAITNGDYVGVFYNTATGLACAGYKKINSAYDTIIAYGTDLGQNNGFANGEAFKWKIWKESTAMVHEALATYDLTAPNAGNFFTGGASKVLQLKGGTLSVLASPGPTVCPGTQVNMQIIVTGGYPPYTYSWTPATHLTNPNIANPVASPMQTTTYTISVTDNIGLSGSATSTISIIPPPQVTQAPLPSYCHYWPPQTLVGGMPPGGTYSGNHVTGGQFSPIPAGYGYHMIIYSYADPITTCIGKDTVFAFVDICESIMNTEEPTSWAPFPNPFRDKLFISGGEDREAQVEASLYHLDGRPIFSCQETRAEGDTWALNTTFLGPGLYLLKIVNKNQSSIFKVLKMSE